MKFEKKIPEKLGFSKTSGAFLGSFFIIYIKIKLSSDNNRILHIHDQYDL